MATAIRPIGHEDRLSIVEHLDELRTRLIVSVVALVVAFGVCFWQNSALLDFVGKPLEHTTQTRTKEGKGPLGQIYEAQRGARQLALQNVAVFGALAKDRTVSPALRATAAVQLGKARETLKQLPNAPPPNKPVTLGVGEPFMTAATVSLYFALLFAGPIILWQLYGFVLPAFNATERRLALPLMSMIPALFIVGVVFGYLVVLPAATSFLQNYNSDSFNVLVQARDYYKFAALILLAMGLVFQLPVGVLALTRLRIISVRTLRKNRRYAYLVLAVIAAALPGVDPVSMLIELAPLLILFEVSVVLARVFGGSGDAPALADRFGWGDDDEDDEDEEEDDDWDDEPDDPDRDLLP
jgi:sec-independent protein translocase protein TatC